MKWYFKEIFVTIIMLVLAFLMLKACISCTGFTDVRNNNIKHDEELNSLVGKKVKIINDTLLIMSEGKYYDKLILSNGKEIDFKAAEENLIK